MKIAFTLLALAAASVASAVDIPTSDAQTRVKSLQQELIATWKEAVDSAEALRKNARASVAEVFEVQRQLLDATLDAAETKEERIGILQSIVELQRKWEAWAEGARGSARVSPVEALRAKAARIKAEIALEKERSVGAKLMVRPGE
jgi:hypothetical protein